MKSWLLAAGLVLAGSPACAGDALTEAIDAAYPPYRSALFRTNSGEAAESAQAIDTARQKWTALRMRFEAGPPAPYDRDRTLARTFAEVDAVYARAAAEVRDRRLAQAHETLEAVRDLLGELRRRNGVVAWSDHVNAYHAEMEKVLLDGPKLLDGTGGITALALQAGALEHLARRLDTEAPATLRAQPGFGEALLAVQASVDMLRSALLAQDAAAIRRAIAPLKPPFSRLFLRFG
jgi:hypothetical protein